MEVSKKRSEKIIYEQEKSKKNNYYAKVIVVYKLIYKLITFSPLVSFILFDT